MALSNFELLCDNHLTDRAPLDAFKVVLLLVEGVTFDADPQVFASPYDSMTSVWGRRPHLQIIHGTTFGAQSQHPSWKITLLVDL